jgi:aminopeptidase N
VASYARPKKGAAKKLANLAMKTIDYYQNFLGPFPFKEYNVVEINQLGWGQAPPATMFITAEAFTPWFARVWSKGINHRFAHEIAHQYWGHVVKMGSPEEQWITESFAEYCSSFVVRQVRGKDGYRDLVADWQANAEVAHEKSSIMMANRLWNTSDSAFYDRIYLIYDKGALFLAALHEEAGDAAFASFLRSYQNSMAWKFGATEHMPGLLEMITGDDYTKRFEDCVWGTRMPKPPKVLRGS